MDKAGIREAPSTRGDCVWRISKLIRRAKSLAEPAVCCTLPRTCSGQAPALGDQSVAWESAPISGGLSATGGRNLPDPWSYRQRVPSSLTRGTLGHAEPFHGPTLPVRLLLWSPVTRGVHSLEMEMPIASKTIPCPRPECHRELSAFRQVPPKGNLWYGHKVGLGEASFPNSARMPSISASRRSRI